MSQLEILKKRREVANSIRIMNRNRNCLKWGANESNEHVRRKLEICQWLKKQGKTFYTEAIFIKGQGRCDVINADDQIVYEIYDSESKESLKNKFDKYPFEVRFVTAKGEFKEEMLL